MSGASANPISTLTRQQLTQNIPALPSTLKVVVSMVCLHNMQPQWVVASISLVIDGGGVAVVVVVVGRGAEIC